MAARERILSLGQMGPWSRSLLVSRIKRRNLKGNQPKPDLAQNGLSLLSPQRL